MLDPLPPAMPASLRVAPRVRARAALIFALMAGAAPLAADPPPGEPAATPPTPAAAPTTHPAEAGPPKPATAPDAPATSKPAPVVDAEPEVQLFLFDGRRFTGFLVEKNANEFIIRIAGIKTPFKASQVERHVILPPVLERYRDLKKAIDSEDPDQVLRLVEWLSTRNQLDLAMQELDALLKAQPENAKALKVRTQLLRQIDLRSKSVREAAPGGGDVEPEPVHGTGPQAWENFPLLSDRDIATMKVYEVDLSRPPRIDVPREVMTSLIETHGSHPSMPTSREGRDALYRLPGLDQLELIFKVRARELYSQVRVIDQPESMRLFRDEVQRTWLLPSCATAACHGGSEAGRLVLATKRPSGDAALYTNFYILQNFKLADGTPLLNFDEPEKSALVQMALPREDAGIKHPRVARGPGEKDMWKPSFRSRDDARLKQTFAWLQSAYRPRPDYGIRYTPVRPFTADVKRPDPGR